MTSKKMIEVNDDMPKYKPRIVGKFITNKMVYEHKEKYPTFDADKMIEWLEAQNNRHWFKTVAQANNLRRRYENNAYLDKFYMKSGD